MCAKQQHMRGDWDRSGKRIATSVIVTLVFAFWNINESHFQREHINNQGESA
jgi:hypothetical protein